MRASSRRSHHSSAAASGREAPAHGEAFGSRAPPARPRSRLAPVPAAPPSAVLRHRPEPFEPAAQDLDQRVLARPCRVRHGSRRGDRRRRASPSGQSARNCGRRSAVIHTEPPGVSQPRRASVRRQLGQPLAPAWRRLALLRRSESRARPARRAARRRWRRRARPPRARARSPRDRAGRGRRRPPAPASAGPSPPACGAPPAARRRDRRRAAPTAPRAPAATARSGRARRPGSRRLRAAPSSRSRPSMSIASFRQSAMVWRTSGWSGISRSPTRFSAQASWSGKTAAIRSSASMRASCGGTFLPPRKRGSASATPATQRQRVHEHRRVEQRLDQQRPARWPNADSAGPRPDRSCARWSATARCCPRSPPPAARN